MEVEMGAILKLVEEVGGLKRGVADMEASVGKSLSGITSSLTVIQNGGMAICKERGERMDRFQTQITALRNGKKPKDYEDHDDGTDLELSKGGFSLKRIPVSVLVAVVAVVVLGGVAGVIGWAALTGSVGKEESRKDVAKAQADRTRMEILDRKIRVLVAEVMAEQDRVREEKKP